MPSALVLAQRRHVSLIMQLIKYGEDNGYAFRYGDAYRSEDKLKCPQCHVEVTYQELLVANGKSKLKRGTHNDRLANDLVIERIDGVPMTDEDYLFLGEYWELLGGRWGGRFGLKLIDGKWVNEKGEEKIGWDAGHFETILKT